MKKMRLISLLALLSIASAPAFARGAIEGKLGLGSVKAASNKAGFDAGLAYAIRLERFFAIVPEFNFNWLSYDNQLGSVGTSGLSGAQSVSSSFYTFPVLLNGRLYIPMGSDETPYVQPIINVGAGYGWSEYSATVGGVSSKASLSGFMYQASVGVLVNLGMIADGSSSSTNLMLEAGYRGGSLATGGVNFDWGGYLIRAGVNFAL